MKFYTLLFGICCIISLEYLSAQEAIITGKIENSTNYQISINSESKALQENGVFTFATHLIHPTILNIQYQNIEWEVYMVPGKTVEMYLDERYPDEIMYRSDLIQENNYLLQEKKINNNVTNYLNRNWFTLHRKGEPEFLSVIDSLKSIYLNNLQKNLSKGIQLSPEFIDLNKAAIHYAFDRMVLRYPEQHFNFTGKKITLSPNSQDFISSSEINAPEYSELQQYQIFTRTWLDKEIENKTKQIDFPYYSGKAVLEIALDLIPEIFTSRELKDFWSFEYIKSHIERYTWINGKDYVQKFLQICQTSSVKQDLQDYVDSIIISRSNHDIHVYKVSKGYQLEAHIFNPETITPNQEYPVLAVFHGGGWTMGNASWTYSDAAHAAEQGFIGVAVEYRLSNRDDISPADALEDARDLVRWLRSRSDSLHIDSDRIAAKGISAGGHLVSSISVIPDTLPGSEISSVPNALILVSPALDMQDQYFQSLLAESNLNAKNLSALENLQSGMKVPPTLILQGRTDRQTPTTYAQRFKEKMDYYGYSCQLVIFENCGHLFTPSHLDDTGWPQPDPEISRKALKKQDEFLKELGYINGGRG